MNPSIQYQISHPILANDVLNHPQAFFPEIILSGKLPIYLAARWLDTSKYGKQEGIPFSDIDRVITPDDFKCQAFLLETNFIAVLIEFPDFTEMDASGKCGLIVSSSYMPVSYFVLEYGQDFLTKAPIFYTGRWRSIDGRLQHINYGPTKDKEQFIRKVFEILQKENPESNMTALAEQILNPEKLKRAMPKEDSMENTKKC